MTNNEDHEVAPLEFLGAVLRISPEDAEKPNEAAPRTRANRLDDYDLPLAHTDDESAGQPDHHGDQ